MAIVHIVSATPAGGVNGATTAGVDTTGANLIVVPVVSSSGTTPTLTDSNSNTWTPLTAQSASGHKVQLYYCLNPVVGAAHTFTVAAINSFSTVGASAFSGVKTSSPFDVQNGGTQAAGTTVQPGSVTPTENNELVITAVSENAAGVFSINLSFVLAVQLNYNSGVNFGSAIGYIIQTTAGAVNPTWTKTLASTSLNAAIATFKADAGAAAVSGFRSLLGVGI